jgi:hypothetical protein
MPQARALFVEEFHEVRQVLPKVYRAKSTAQALSAHLADKVERDAQGVKTQQGNVDAATDRVFFFRPQLDADQDREVGDKGGGKVTHWESPVSENGFPDTATDSR